MNIGDDLRTFLLADSDVSTEVGASRIWPDKLPQSWGPTDGKAITFFLVSGPREYNFTGPAGRVTPLYQIDIWGETRAGVDDLADKVRQRLNGYSGTMGSVAVDNIMLEQERDDATDQTNLRRKIQSYRISLTES